MKNIIQSFYQIWNLRKNQDTKSYITKFKLLLNNSLLTKIYKFLEKLISYIESLKTNSKKQLILKNNELNVIKNFLSSSSILIWLKRLIHSEEQFIFFLNIPNIISVIFFEIGQNIKKKIIYFYQIILMFMIPVIIYNIQNNISTKPYKNKKMLEYITGKTIHFNDQRVLFIENKVNRSPQIEKNYKSELSSEYDKKYIKKIKLKKQIELDLSTRNQIKEIKEIFVILKNKIYNTNSKITFKNDWISLENSFDDSSIFFGNTFLLKILKNDFTKKRYQKIYTECQQYSIETINKIYIFFIKNKSAKYLNSENFSAINTLKNKQKDENNLILIKNLSWLTNIDFYEKFFYYKKKIKNYEKNTFNLLNNQRKIWRYKFNESFNINYTSKNFNQEKNKRFVKILSINKNIERIINHYWNFYKTNLLNSIIKKNKYVIKTNYYINKNIFKTKHYINKFSQNYLCNKENNFELKNNLVYIPYNLSEKSKNEKIQFADIIKQLHFFSNNDIRNPFFSKNKINKKNLIKLFCIKQIEDIFAIKEKKKHFSKVKINSKIKNITSIILKTIQKSNTLSLVFENKNKFQTLKVIYSNVLKKNDKHLLLNKTYLLNIKNITIKTKYINKFNLDYKKSVLFLNLEKKRENSEKNRNLYKSLNEAFFLMPLSIFEKQKEIQNIDSFKNNKTFLNIDLSRNLNKTKEKKILIHNKNNNIKFKNARNINILEEYKKWIFTSHWWTLLNKKILNKIPEIIQNLVDNQKLLFPQLRNLASSFTNTCRYFSVPLSLDYCFNLLYKLKFFNNSLFDEIYKSSNKDISIWNVNETNKIVKFNQWAYIGWFLTISILYYHWSSLFTGTLYISIWSKFEKMHSLANPSSNTILNILIQNNIESTAQSLRLTMYSSGGWIMWLKIKIFSYLNKQKVFSIFFFKTNSTDVPRKKKNLVINYYITQKKLVQEYKLWNTNKLKFIKNKNILNSKNYEGLTYLQKWSRNSLRYPKLIQYRNNSSKNFQWLNELYFCGNNYNSVDSQKIPKNLPEEILNKKRWLIVGTPETGKSLFIKNIASNTYLPLIHISLKDIRQATPDEKYNKFKNSNKWVQQLSDRAFLLENALELAKMLSPCIFWISNLHEFHANFTLEKKENKINDTSFLFFMLLKMMTNDLLPSTNSQITFIGSTDSPALLDPKFVSRHRLDFIVNFRKYDFHQRQNFLLNFLQNQNLNVKGKRAFYELGNNTVGYSVRDLRGIANEILLIKTQTSSRFITTNIIRLALYRQSSKQSTNNSILKNQTRKYKIGKAVIQSRLLTYKPILPLTIRNELWKNRFYYLHNAFLEKAIDNSTVTELTVFVHLINCLSGSASSDASLFLKKIFNEKNINISKQLEHDFYLASNILQSLILEFPLRELYSFNMKKKNLSIYYFREKYNMNIMQKTIYSLNLFNQFPSYTYWSYKIERLSLTWSLLFQNIKNINKPINLHSFSQIIQKTISYKTKSKEIHMYGPYEKKRIKEQNKYIQKIHSFFNQIIFEHNLKTIDFPWISEYVLDYNGLQLSILLLDTKALWDPPALKPYYSVLFFNRNLIINRNLLSKFYITYGEKFKSQKLNPKRIKEQSLWSKTIHENSHIAQNSTNKEKIIQLRLEDFDSFKKIANANTYFQSSQIEGRFYLYQSWNDPDYEENFRYSDLLNDRKNIENKFFQYRELLLYGTLVEIYHRLFKFFWKHKFILNKIEKILNKEGIINREKIENILNKTKFL